MIRVTINMENIVGRDGRVDHFPNRDRLRVSPHADPQASAKCQVIRSAAGVLRSTSAQATHMCAAPSASISTSWQLRSQLR